MKDTAEMTIAHVAAAHAPLPAPAAARPSRSARVRRSLLDVPLFWKILLADAGIVFLVGLGGAALAAGALGMAQGPALIVLFIVSLFGVLVTVPVRMLILRKALAPIEILQDTAERVESGDMGARAQQLPLADPRLSRLTGVFNRVLDTVAADRRSLQEIAAKAFHAQEAERARIARELHDDLAQRMAGVLLRLKLVRDAEDAAVREETAGELRDELVRTADTIREFARGLHPPALHDIGLAAAVEGHARGLPDPDAPRIVVNGEDTRGLLTPERELALYRIVQEAISNAVRHAHATEVVVTIGAKPGAVTVEVADDGAGFDVAAARRQRPSLGLFGMRERALYGGGSVEIDTGAGRGTRVRVYMPRDDAPSLPAA